jgi:cytochrome P450
MVLAGSESTAISLAAIFYYILRDPAIHAKLRAEIDEAFHEVPFGEPVGFQAAQNLPYLDACIKEGFRMHPAARFTGERVLPPHGATIAGQKIPGNTVVGVNAWVVHRREDVFGADVETYRPERWLKEENNVAEMNRTLSHFGHGKFMCIGKNISLLEIYKVIPSLLRAFEFELDKPERPFRFESGSFANMSGVDVRLRARH